MMRKKPLVEAILLGFLIVILGYVCVNIYPLPYLLKVSQVKTLKETVFRGKAWFKFDDKGALNGWQEKIFKGRVIYSLRFDAEDGYVHAYSKNAASGLLYWLTFNPRKEPMVSWKWKVVKFPESKQISQQEGGWLERDDYAARFYVIFPRFPFFRMKCLEYVWDKDLPKGTLVMNPHLKNLKVIVAESGDKNLGKWVLVERNIYEDYKKYFGTNPGNAGAIAFMTDSDTTLSTAEAQYDEIKVGYGK